MIVWLALARAGELEVERARTSLAEGRPDAALEQAAAGLADPGDGGAWAAWAVFLDACAAGGVAVGCRAEASVAEAPEAMAALAASDGTTLPEGAPEDARLGRELAGLARSNPDAAAVRALELLGSHPERPDLSLPLFDAALPPQRSVAKAKAKILKTGEKAVKRDLPAPVLHRWHRVFVAASSPSAAVTAGALEAAGMERPMERRLSTRAELVAVAKERLGDPSAPLPPAVPAEHEGLALRLAELLVSGGRPGDAASMLASARATWDTPSLALAHGDALVAHSEWASARGIADEALAAAVAPWPTDLAVSDRPSRRAALAEVYALRGQAWLGEGRSGDAAADLMLANQLARTPLHGAELEKAMEKGWYELEALKATLESSTRSAAEVALERAREAQGREDWPATRAAADEAVRVLLMPSQRKGRLTARLAGQPELAQALALRALADWRTDRGGLVDLQTAVLLLPWNAPADWWSLLAEMRAGQPWAAFFAGAMANALSDADAPTAWPGGGDGVAAGPAMASAWFAGDPGHEPVAERLVVERGRVVAFAKRGGGGSSVPRLNEPFPEWSVDTGHGTVFQRPGRMVFLTFFRSDSAASLGAAQGLTDLARDLRKLGADIIWVGVAIDPDRAAFDAIAGKRDGWGDTAWDPALGKRFGVTAVPTTWVLDDQGVARFQHVGYLGPDAYEAQIRIISGI